MTVDAALPAPTLRVLVDRCAERLGSWSEARWVVQHVAGVDRCELATRLSDAAPAGSDVAAAEIVHRRLAGEPLQYVLGSWSFRQLELAVDPRVLIPRPETEVVAGLALDLLAMPGGPEADEPAYGDARPGRPTVAVDLGTGSGAVALSLALEGPAGLVVWATDRSAEALDVARVNLRTLRRRHPALSEMHLVTGDWFEALPTSLLGSVTLVVSNPPYVASAEWEDLEPSVRDHEPREALVAGERGLEDLELIVDGSTRWLAPNGHLVLEIAPGQAASVVTRASAAGFATPQVEPDLAGRPRVVVARWPGPPGSRPR
jgi:release factor glutamine methyltransferase